MTALDIAIACLSLGLFGLSIFSTYLMLFSWEHPERLEDSKAPKTLVDPRLSFTVLLPARHEQKVIYETVKRIWNADYPKDLLEIVVICSEDDRGTIVEAQRASRDIGSPSVRVETFSDGPINKPHGLNVGLRRSRHEIVTIFDAEDDVDRDVFRVVNTVILQTGAGIVQSGVQLMNYRDHWFSVHNCLEYFFWFKSRLHFHAAAATIPLGGNTVFLRRSLIERVDGWDEHCLTEDADIGFRLSLLGEPIRVVYDAQHVTREETPHSIGQLIKQRTRWHQGFLQVLLKGDWLTLPRKRQRLLALYTLSYPLVQAVLLLMWPLSLVTVLWLKLPVIVAMLSFLPLYALAFQLLVTLVGTIVFTHEYHLRLPVTLPLVAILTFLPYQIVLGASSVRAVARALRRQNNWEKTAHIGAHRVSVPSPATRLEPILHELGDLLGMEHRSLLVRDQTSDSFSIASSQGLPDHVVRSVKVDPEEGIVGWVVRERCPIIIDERPVPAGIGARLRRHDLSSSIVVPIQEDDSVIAVLTLSTREAGRFHDSKLHHLTEYLDQAIQGPATVPGLDRVTA